MDESGFSQRPSVRRTWAPEGRTPVLKHHFNWKRLHAIGAVVCQPEGTNAQGLPRLQPGSVKQEDILAWLSALHDRVPGSLVVLWDGLAAHHSKVVHAYGQENAAWLAMHRLPAYAPELNPVEYLWSVLKGKDVANMCADTISQIESKLHQAAERVEREAIAQGFLRASGLYATKTSAATTPTESH
jgi:transposase